MEQIDLTTPVQVTGGTAFWNARRLELFYAPDPLLSTVRITLFGENGRRQIIGWDGQTAHDDIKALNTANLTNNSLQKRLLARAIQLGKLSGTISGVPDS